MKGKRVNGKIMVMASISLVIIIFTIFDDKETGIAVNVGTPVLSSIVESIPANGKIRPVTEISISPDVSGEIVNLYFKEGDIVHKGDLLLQIDQEVYRSILQQATASLNSTQARYEQQKASFEYAEHTYKRAINLFEAETISKSEYDELFSNYLIAKGSLLASEYDVQSAEAVLKEAQENMRKTSIYSPMDGTISRLLVERGERVVGTSQMAGTEIMTIADFSQMEVMVDVNENDIVKVSIGDTATITVDAHKKERVKGVVTYIANSAKGLYSPDKISSYEVKILILSQDMDLRPGMSASAMIETDRKDEIITIPLQCINSNGCIFVVEEESLTVKEQSILTGIQDINNIEIIDGVALGTKIVIGPYEAINKTLHTNGKIHINRD